MKLRIQLQLFLLMLLYIFPALAFAQPDQSAAKPTRLAIEPKWVKVVIENPEKVSYRIGYVSLNRYYEWFPETYKKEKQTFELPSGKYAIFVEATKTWIAMPAVAKAMGKKQTQLTVRVVNQKHERDGMIHIIGGPTLLGDEIGVGAPDERLSIESIDEFWIAKYEVTNKQYVEFLNARKKCSPDWLDLFTDLPSPVYILDAGGRVRAKFPWPDQMQIKTAVTMLKQGKPVSTLLPSPFAKAK